GERGGEGEASGGAEGEERVEGRATSGLGGARRYPIEQAEFERRGEIEDIVPDRDAAAGDAARRGEHAERQVLDRKVGVLMGRGEPAAPRGGMGLVDPGFVFFPLPL